MKGKVTTFINNRLNFILNGKPFDIWCEETVDQSAISKVPIDLRDYFIPQKITETIIDPTLSYYAKIDPCGDHFVLTLQRPFILSSSNEDRYSIAHEIAHTFQYKIKDDNLIEQTQLLPGSFEIEFFCNRLARTLIIPRKILIPYLRNLPQLDSPHFSLKFFNALSSTFIADYKLILQRSILDLEFFGDFILLRFLELSEKNKWGLLERYLSNKFHYDKKYFIPFLNQDSQRPIDKRLPLCANKLNQFLNKYQNILGNNEEQSIIIEAGELLDRPLGWFLKNYNNKTLNVCKISRVKSLSRNILNLSISFNPNHIL